MPRKTHRVSRRKRVNSRVNFRKNSRKSKRINSHKSLCRKRLSRKIGINMKEGRWPQKQAIAIAYSQVRKSKRCARIKF